MTGRDAREPEIVEMFGQPEIYADGAVVKDAGEVVMVILYVRRGSECREVGRIHMPRGGFEEALAAANRAATGREFN
jgi:hypothetical protein